MKNAWEVTEGRERGGREKKITIINVFFFVNSHNDLPWNIRKFVHNRLRDLNLNTDLRNLLPWSKSPWSQTDLPRLKQGMIGGQFWAAYVPCESQHLNAVQLTLEQIDVIKRLIDKYHRHLKFATSATGEFTFVYLIFIHF